MPELRWSHGRAAFSPTAAMLVSAEFLLPDGPFSPFASRAWDADDPALSELPGHLRVLGGDFICVPFGSAPGPGSPMPGWEAFEHLPPDEPPHGHSAEEDWGVEDPGPDAVRFALEYPPGSAVERLERTVRGVPGSPALQFSLTITARRPALMPVGVHPIFRMPDPPARVHIEAGFDVGFGYPGALDGAAVRPGAEFRNLGEAGGADLSRLPLGPPVDDVVLLGGCTGPVRLAYPDERARVELDWDCTVLPSLMLWISDRALDGQPWNRAYRGIGVEPVAAAFDLPSRVSAGENPLGQRGVRTAVALDPVRPVTIRYSVSAHPFDLGVI
ncbi:hypothetical protein ACFFGH_13120 [Lysobacter korlensis]|uniref:Aldose 1-epimerase n=1 Tax=Lysobacter korlensis TaxID=553636 RepID=A0ABV6RP78_9GAMM